MTANFNPNAHPQSPSTGRFVEVAHPDPGPLLDDGDDEMSAAWTRRGLSKETAERWSEAGFTPAGSDAWRRAWFDVDTAAQWRQHGFEAADAAAWREADFTPASASNYTQAGFEVADAVEWRRQSAPEPPAPAGATPGRGDGGPADLSEAELDALEHRNPYRDLVIPPSEVPGLRHR